MAYVSKGLLVEGIRALKKGVELEPNRPQAHYQLAQAYKKAGKIDEAQKELEVFQKLDTKNRDKRQEVAEKELQ
jgi:Tfp pilus assembly protein PilF